VSKREVPSKPVLLAAGQGYRCHLGDCVLIEVQQVKD
jgi:hypothetical protein